MADLAAYSGYEALKVTRREHGVLDIVMSGEGANRSGLATANERMHRELADIWRDVDRDPDTRVAVIRGEGKGFSAGAISRSSSRWRTTSTCAPAYGGKRATSSTT